MELDNMIPFDRIPSHQFPDLEISNTKQQRSLKNILFVNRNRTMKMTDDMFHTFFKPQQYKKQYAVMVLETAQDCLGRFLKENGDIKYHALFSGGELIHFFKKESQ